MDVHTAVGEVEPAPHAAPHPRGAPLERACGCTHEAGRRPWYQAAGALVPQSRSMKDESRVAASIDEYLAGLPAKTRAKVQAIRRALHELEPGLEERISYRIPAFRLGGQYLLYVAAFTHHVGVYPAPQGDAAFEAAVAPFRSGKATLQFALDAPLPLDLIAAVVRFRKQALAAHARTRAAAKTVRPAAAAAAGRAPAAPPTRKPPSRRRAP
jgi:uncharacterized protein YdhG (YjbR/CyaY superfamily)